MHAIRQFVESLALGLGLGLFLVVCAIFVLDLAEPTVEPGNGPGAVSSPETQQGLRRDENGVPLVPGSRDRQGAALDRRVG